MKPLDLWLVAFGLRCCALLGIELFCFLYAIPTLFDLHSNLADFGAAALAIAAVLGASLWGAALAREWALLIKGKDDE